MLFFLFPSSVSQFTMAEPFPSSSSVSDKSSTYPDVFDPKNINVKRFLAENEEEVWYVEDEEDRNDASRKRKYSEVSTPSSSSSSSSSRDTADDQLLDLVDIDESVWSALQPYRYTESRRLHRQRHRLPRLPKNDLRRSYLAMFSNVINAHNEVLLKAFLKAYCNPSMDFHRICLDAVSFPRHEPFPLDKYCTPDSLVNRYYMADAYAMWAIKNYINPDIVTQFSQPRVITTRASNKIRLEAEYVVRKTEIYDIDEDDLQYFLLQKVVSGYFRGAAITEDSAFVNKFSDTVTKRPQRQHNGLYPLPLSKTPRHVELKGFMSFIIDENRRIESMLFFPSSVDIR